MDGHIGKLEQGCPKCASSISKLETEWLDYMKVNKENRHPKMFKINNKKLKPDAYDPAINTIYEFYGDYWHGNPSKFKPDDINATNHKSYGELYAKTLEKEQIIKSAGYSLITIWESDWNIIKKTKINETVKTGNGSQ
jgi:hypothetical protein